MNEQQHNRREPKRAEHPEPVPQRSAYPLRRAFPHPWCCRSDLKDGGRRGKLGHSSKPECAVNGALRIIYSATQLLLELHGEATASRVDSKARLRRGNADYHTGLI